MNLCLDKGHFITGVKVIGNKIVNDRIKLLFSRIDKNYSRKYKNLTYDKKESKILDSDNEEVYLVKLVINEKENVMQKLVYLSKTIYVKYYIKIDNIYDFYIEIPKKGELNLKTEHDSTNEAWEFYYYRYGDQLKKEKFTINGTEFDVHGEVDFNFGMDKINEFKYIIENDNDKKATPEKKQFAKKLLDICSCYNYSLLNYSIMPSVGNLQATKGSIGKDRFDVFIWALDLYDNGIDLILNSKTTAQNLNELIKILNAFQGMKQYCEIIYDISDSNLISDLIDSGKKRIDNTDRVLEYISLAFRVWQTRRNIFSRNQCNKLLKGKNSVYDFSPYLDQLKNSIMKK